MDWKKESSVLADMRNLFEVVDVQPVDIDGVATYEVCGWVVWKSCLPALWSSNKKTNVAARRFAFR